MIPKKPVPDLIADAAGLVEARESRVAAPAAVWL
jgi:hypothetical protein